jgi:hypothetical protein
MHYTENLYATFVPSFEQLPIRFACSRLQPYNLHATPARVVT